MSSARTALVTGASAGIGQATARVLADIGYGLVIGGRREERLSALTRELAAKSVKVKSVVGDVRSDPVVEQMLAAALEEWGRVPDAFVLCAGSGLPGTVLTSDPEKWVDLFDTNLLSVLRQLRAVGNAFTEGCRRDGRVRDIVIIGSTVGRVISRRNPVYGATKFAVHSLTEALRREVCDAGLRVSLVEPGFVVSEFQSTAGYDMEWFETIAEEFGPLLAPTDVARTVAFILDQPPHVHVDNVRIRPARQQV